MKQIEYPYQSSDLKEFWNLLCFCTSSERNVERPKAQLKAHTVDKAFRLNTDSDSDFGWVQKKFRRFQHKTNSKC